MDLRGILGDLAKDEKNHDTTDPEKSRPGDVAESFPIFPNNIQ